MSRPLPVEDQLLERSRRVLDEAVGPHGGGEERKLEILEGAASRLGGFSLGAYRRTLESEPSLATGEALDAADDVLRTLKSAELHPSLALCALARPTLPPLEQRRTGVYYTDFRLARYMARSAAEQLTVEADVIDPACGTGMLLVAAGLQVVGPRRTRRTVGRWLANRVTAADLSPDALRATRLSLASLTDDIAATREMVARWRCQDSLLSWSDEHPSGDVILGNPPWEKVKLTRHEYLRAGGTERHYGADYSTLDEGAFAEQRSATADYGRELSSRYPLVGDGERDLYKAFLELFLRLVRPGGCVSVLVPAGLIRSQGATELRKYLFDHDDEISVTVFENRALFFAIDTRFKFVALALTRRRAQGPRRARTLKLSFGGGEPGGVKVLGKVAIPRATLASLRPDLTLPEVRSAREWHLFRTMSERGEPWADPGSAWHPKIVREIDMTRDHALFAGTAGAHRVPVVEGRMIHQYRFPAKAYREGSGRRARWDALPPGTQELAPQFWIDERRLPEGIRERVVTPRAGFCDITGQTNERSMLAALVPAGVVCGNKVPTVTFPRDETADRLFLWLAIANSLPFDWALRRIVTTTVNYFVLLSAPLPRIEPDSLAGRCLVAAARELHSLSTGAVPPDLWRIAKLRATVDVWVARSYGLAAADLAVMLADFPLLDRGQPPLPGEERSTVTRDHVLSCATEGSRPGDPHAERLQRARELGAVPYIPAEFARAGMVELDEASGG